MRKTCLIGIMTIVTLIGNGTAQPVLKGDTAAWAGDEPAGEELPVECGGPYAIGFLGGIVECTFQCRAGDYIYVEGSISNYNQAAKFTAFCDGVEMVACAVDGEYHPWSCLRATDSPVKETGIGRCTAQRLYPYATRGEYKCYSVTPPE